MWLPSFRRGRGRPHNLPQRNHHEVALGHAGMRYLQVGLIDDEIVEEEDIDVDGAVVIFVCAAGLVVTGLAAAAELAFYLLSELKHLSWRMLREHPQTSV